MDYLSSMSVEPKAVKRKSSRLGDSEEGCRKKGPPQSSLCARCVELCLEHALSDIEPPYRVGLDVKIADVGLFYRQQSSNGCNLCQVLSASRILVEQSRKKPQDDEDGDELHVFNLWDDLSWVGPNPLRYGLWRGQSTLYLAVVPSGFTRNDKVMKLHGESNGFTVFRRRGTPQPQVYAPQIVSPIFDITLARNWTQYCKANHERLCSLKNKTTRELHLIDCRSLEVISAPDEAEYTALSYVWGVPISETNTLEPTVLPGSNGLPLPSPVPAVITDAISVTTGLGFHYLWVDRYCIDQNSHSKHQQINQMDSIYRDAEVTIVAAAGNGPEYGLPGINSRSRCGQHAFTLGDFEIITTLRHPHRTIQSSKWSTRGWTFQEAALSRRNLVFTDDQVYFECNAMNCHESFSSNLDRLHIENKSEFRDLLQVGLFGRTEKQKYGHFDECTLTPAHNLVRFMGMVEQYTARDLTYDSDSLNAFTGIIRKFETSHAALSQIWGVPFCRGENERQTNRSFLDGLAWSHKATVCDGGRGRPRRRPGLPSWSWAGWAGEIQYEGRSLDGMPTQLGTRGVYVSVEHGAGLGIISLHAYLDEAKTGPQETMSTSAIHMEALALPASAFSYDPLATTPILQVFQYPARLALSTGPWEVPGFCQSLLNADRRQCIYLGHLLKSVVIMVLEAQDDGWSRVGVVFVDEVWYWHFRSSWKQSIERSSDEKPTPLTQGIKEKVKSFRII